MSFGFSVGDFIAVFQQANRLRKDFSTAPAQYQAIATEVKNFSVLIEDVITYLTSHTPSAAQQKELSEIALGCRQTLSDVENVLSKYSSLEPGRATGLREFTKRVWQRVKLEPDDIRDFRSRIIANISLLSAYADGFERKTLADLVSKHDDLAQEQHAIFQKQLEQEHQEVLNWLAPLDYVAQHSNHASHRLVDTGQWLLDSPEYIWWSSRDNENGILYLQGIPGAGKTMLSSIIIDNVQAKYALSDDVGVCYYYCDYSRQNERKLEQILLCLLRQLANPIGLDIITRLYRDCTLLGVRPSFSAIKDALYATVERLSQVFIIIDALDECQSVDGCQKNLLKELSELNKFTASKVNIIITSRHPYDLILSSGNLKSMEVLASSQDIGRYVMTHIQHLPNFVAQRRDLQEEIKAAIINAVGGIFLLATLHFRALQGKRSVRQLRLTLNSLSSLRYPEAYTSTLNRICSQVEDQKTLAIDTLTWIVYAQRSLTTAELLHALAVEIDSPEFYEDDIPDINDVLSTCCGLVVVEPETQFVRLVHRTTQEFLKEYGSTWLPKAHTKLSKVCNTYLAFEVLSSVKDHTEESFTDLLADYPLYDYASWHWSDHAGLREDLSMEELVANQKLIDESSKTLMAYTAPEYLSLRRKHPDITGLHLLAYCGRADMMPKFLERYDVNEADELMRTPISCAVQENQLEAARTLIENGARLDDRYEDIDGTLKLSTDKSGSIGDSLVLHTINLRNDAMMLLLMEAGAGIDVNTSDLGKALLFKAIKRKDIDGMRLLLDNGAKIDYANPDGWTPIQFACKYGDIEVIQFLLDSGADPETHAGGQNTPVQIAYSRGHLEITEMLLKKGCNLTVENFSTKANLCAAAEKGCIEIVKLLLEKNIDINEIDRAGWTPLTQASSSGQNEVVQLLLDRGAEIDKYCGDDWSALCLAAANDHVETVQLLLDRGADINEAGDDWTALCIASQNGHIEVVQLLLNRGADLNKSNGGWTGLFNASQNGHIEVVRLLLSRGADINIADFGGCTPLFRAAWKGHMEIVKLLHPKEISSTAGCATLSRRDREGRTVFDIVARRGDVAMLNYFLESSDIPADEDEFGRNLLDYASMSSSKEMIQRVLELYQARNLNIESSSAWSPLHWACRNGTPDIITLLTNAGLKTKEVETEIPAVRWSPFDVAVYYRNENLVPADGDTLENHSWLQSLKPPGVTGGSILDSTLPFRSNRLVCPGKSFDGRCNACWSTNMYGARFHCNELADWPICVLCKLDVHPGYEWYSIESNSALKPDSDGSEDGNDSDDSGGGS